MSDDEQTGTRQSVTAAVLNLTGLGFGYLYLGRWRRAVLHVAAVVLLVFVAFATDAADRPWLWRGIVIIGLAWMAWDGWRLARRTDPAATMGGRVAPAMLMGGLLIALMAGGYLIYGAVGRQIYADGVTAQSQGDCVAAIPEFDIVTGPYELTLSRDVPAARENRAQCLAFVAASNAQARGAYADAAAAYREFREANPRTVLVPFVQANLMRTYTEWAGERRAAGDYPEAIRRYRDLLAEAGSGPVAVQAREEIAATLAAQATAAKEAITGGASVDLARTAVEALLTIQREFGDTTPAAQVPQALLDTYTAANVDFVNGSFCEALPVLDYFVTLPVAETAGLVATADSTRVQAMLECGFEQFRTRNYLTAIQQLDALAAAYPDSPQATQARSAIIAAKVGAESSGAEVPIPAPLGDDSPGPNPVTFYNDSPYEVRVLVAGPTAHEFILPACPDCPATYTTPDEACPTFDGRPSATLRLAPGTFYLLVGDTSDTVTKLSDLFVVSAGFEYTDCLHVEPEPSTPSLLDSPFDIPRLTPLEPVKPR